MALLSNEQPGIGDALPYPTEDAARRALIEHARAMNRAGVNVGKAGNLSLRWPRSAATGLLVTPSAIPYDDLAVDDIVWLPLAAADAAAVDGQRPPSSEWRLHRDILAARPDVGCVLHAHGPESAALACSARIQRDGVPAFHYMVAVAGGSDIRCGAYALFGTQQLSDIAVAALQERRACLLANHGLVVAAATVPAALALAVDVEALCGQYRRLLALGDPVILDDGQMRAVLKAFEGYGR